jgi:NADH-quinone oxidoreductase subunit N
MNTLFVIAGVGILALIAEIINFKRWLTIICILGLAGALAFLPWYTGHTESAPIFKDMLMFDGPAVAFTWLIVMVAILWMWMSGSYLKEGQHQTDKTSLVVFVVLGAVIMASFNNMAMLFLGLEILSLSLYALAGSKKDSLNSIESAFKYFLMGSFATGFLIFGIALIYGASHSFNLGEIFNFVRSNYDALPGYFYAGVLMMMVGLAFKISAVPFHFWAPDVYDGAPTAITSLMATVVKIAAISAFWRIFGFIFGLTSQFWIAVLYAMVILTLVIPNITAIYQQKAKRMLAYSSIAHVGYILLGFVAALKGMVINPLFIIFYLAAYSVSSLAAFSVLMRVEENGGSFQGLYYRNKWMAVTMTVALMSMAGIPPMAGFAAKYFVFLVALSAQQLPLVILAVVTSAISVYYYFRIIIQMFSKDEASVEPVVISWSIAIFNFLMLVIMIVLGIFPSIEPLLRLIRS